MEYIGRSSSYYRDEEAISKEIRSKFEGFLVEACDHLPMFKSDVNVIVDLIIMAEFYSF